MNKEKKHLGENIVIAIFGIALIWFTISIVQTSQETTNKMSSLCYENKGTIQTEDCGYACTKNICIFEENGKFYKKEVKKINGEWILIENGGN